MSQIVAGYAAKRDPGREAAWIAEADGWRAGCLFCVAGTDGRAQLRLLPVDPAARGKGTGARLVAGCVGFARRAGYRELVLWTNDPLTSAARIYLAARFRLVSEQGHHSFGHDLVGQNYSLDLRQAG